MTNNIILDISPAKAREIALREARATQGVFASERLIRDGGRVLYELGFAADGMLYTCYVDAGGGEVLGFYAEPAAA